MVFFIGHDTSFVIGKVICFMDKKKIFWAIASVFIAALSIWAVISQSRNFSFDTLKSFISGADKGWFLASFVCTFGFIWFEGFALVRIARHFEPQLTTIIQDTKRLGEEAALKLISLIENPKSTITEQIVVTGEIFEGKSLAKLN